MAYTREEICPKCGKLEMITNLDKACHKCIVKENNNFKIEFLLGLAGLTLDERVRRLESQLYDMGQKSHSCLTEFSN